jgi:anti-sigma factor RsiW
MTQPGEGAHVGDQLSAYVDAQVTKADRLSIDSHLSECIGCRDELDAIASARQRIRALPMLDPPARALRLPAEVLPLRRARRRVLVAAAATVALVVGIGVGAGGNQTVPLQLDAVVEQHVARASVDPGLNVMQVQVVANR